MRSRLYWSFLAWSFLCLTSGCRVRKRATSETSDRRAYHQCLLYLAASVRPQYIFYWNKMAALSHIAASKLLGVEHSEEMLLQMSGEKVRVNDSPGKYVGKFKVDALKVEDREDLAPSLPAAQYHEEKASFRWKDFHEPLTRVEECQLFADVQDLFFLTKKRSELTAKLGIAPTDQQWANCVGCSVCQLYARIGKGRAAKRKMIAANLPLVGSIAKELNGLGLSYRELFQEGALGLVKSTEKFDVSFGTKFSTYAYFWIREKMLSAIQKFQQLFTVGRSLHRRKMFILECKDRFRQQHCRNPSLDELAKISKIDKQKIRQVFSVIQSRSKCHYCKEPSSLMYKEAEDHTTDLPWLMMWRSEVREELDTLFSVLGERESQVLDMKYGLQGNPPLTLFQIAASLGVSHEAVRRTEKRALEKLRNSAKLTGLQLYNP